MKVLSNILAMTMLGMVLFTSTAMAIFSDMAVQVNQTPEPAKMVMMGLAMLAISVLGRKLKNK